MEITNVEVRRVDYDKLKAFAKVTFGHELEVKGFKIIEGSKGLFVGLPSEKSQDGKYYPTVYINDENLYRDLQTAVLAAYNEGASEGAVDENDGEDDGEVKGSDDPDNLPF